MTGKFMGALFESELQEQLKDFTHSKQGVKFRISKSEVFKASIDLLRYEDFANRIFQEILRRRG